jgi:hypothetical protein
LALSIGELYLIHNPVQTLLLRYLKPTLAEIMDIIESFIIGYSCIINRENDLTIEPERLNAIEEFNVSVVTP